jgi:hypothetical protein
MLHACLYTICFVFCLHSWHFYVFSRTNLLTRCHSASSLFSTVFVFQKSYTGNIVGIGRNEARSSYFPRHETKSKAEMKEGQEVAIPPGGAGAPVCATTRCEPLGHLLTLPLCLYKAFDAKILNQSVFS